MVKVCAIVPPDLENIHDHVKSFGKDKKLEEESNQKECDIVLTYSLARDYASSTLKKGSKHVHVLVHKTKDKVPEIVRDLKEKNVLLIECQDDQGPSEDDCTKILDLLTQQGVHTDSAHCNSDSLKQTDTTTPAGTAEDCEIKQEESQAAGWSIFSFFHLLTSLTKSDDEDGGDDKYGDNLVHLESEPDDSPTVRFFRKVLGGFQKHNKDFPLYLKNFNFIEVSSSDLCDVILNFCPAEVGPYIEDILKETPACKPTILALMHHTKDPAYVVPDSSSIEKKLCKKNIHIVDFLYHEDIGLLKCENNDSSIKEILGSLEWDMCEDAKEAECPSVRVHKIVPRSIKNHISSFKICLDNSPNVTQVDTSEWSDVTLAFCPIVSRVGTDIEATLKDIEDSKPAILVVMHHTFDEQYVIPDTKRFEKNKDILIVDCVFHEDLGLLPCKTNKKALEQIKMYLMHEEGKKKPSQSVDSSSVTQKSFWGYILTRVSSISLDLFGTSSG